MFTSVAAKQAPAKKAESSSDDSDETSDDDQSKPPTSAARKPAVPTATGQKRKHGDSSEDSSEDDDGNVNERESTMHKSVSGSSSFCIRRKALLNMAYKYFLTYCRKNEQRIL